MSCEHCNGPGENEPIDLDKVHITGSKCCWARAKEIQEFQKKVKHKYIFEPLFDLIVSVTSVGTDLLALLMYLWKGKYVFAGLTSIPVLLPTLVFTNVYLMDESRRPLSKVSSISGNKVPLDKVVITMPKPEPDSKARRIDQNEIRSLPNDDDLLDENIDNMFRPLFLEEGSELEKKCFFHFSCLRRPCENIRNCFKGCVQCLLCPNLELRRRGARLVKKSMQRMFKYGIGTVVLRFIACTWYVKAFIFGVKAYREPKKYMRIQTPDHHWSYQLLVRLEFLQAALENAPQCVLQLYALITQSDEDKILGMFTLAFSFIDFIRVSVSVHWDMDKGPVTAPSGCYKSLWWKLINTSSWMMIYSARSAAIAFIFATSGFTRPEFLFPFFVLLFHIILFSRILSKAEYGVAAQKIVVTVFISLFFLPELASAVLPAIPQFYYATIIIENAFFILPWDGFEKEYCVTSGGGLIEVNKTNTPRATFLPIISSTPPGITVTSLSGEPTFIPKQITASTPATEKPPPDCLIDPTLVTLAVPTLTVIGVIFRLASTQKMVNFRKTLPQEDVDRDNTQQKFESSIANLFSKKWSRMTIQQLSSAFLRMLRKEVIIVDKENRGRSKGSKRRQSTRKISLMNHPQLQAKFLASQTFIRESFSLMTRTTRSHDFQMEGKDNESPPPEYNSDSELTFRLGGGRKRPRISRSRNVSESTNAPDGIQDCTLLPVEFPSGERHYLETCWV